MVDVVRRVLRDDAMQPMTKLGCFQTSPPSFASIWPVSNLTKVDFPDPLGPRMVTRDYRETWGVMSYSCCTG